MSDDPELQRVTTEYVPTHDRIRLSGVDAEGRTMVLWMTQRLFNRLVPSLTKWLEENGSTDLAKTSTPSAVDREMLQGFAQQSARASLQPQPAVRAESPVGEWLVDEIDVSIRANGVALLLKSGAGQRARLVLSTRPLRQWLGIVHEMYVKAEWATTAWPNWMEEARSPAAKPDAIAVH